MQTTILIVLTLISIALGVQTCHTKQENSQLSEAYQHAHDSATTYVNRYGQQVAQNRTLQLTTAQLAKLPAENDRLLAELQRQADQFTLAAAAFSAERTGTAVGATTTVIYKPAPITADTSTKHRRLPTYRGTAKGDGFTAEVEASSDSVRYLRIDT